MREKLLLILTLLFSWFSIFPTGVFAATTYDVADSSKWNIRIDGAVAGDNLGYYSLVTADINGDNKDDLLIGSPFSDNNSRTNSGSVYVIYNNLLTTLQGKGNTIDLADSSRYNLRFDGVLANGWLSYQNAVYVADIDNDGKKDILMGAPRESNNGVSASGSLYVLFNTLLDDYTGTGNNIDLATSTNYNLRYDGSGTNDWLTQFSVATGDLNNNGKTDLLVGSIWSNNAGTDTGSVYIIFDSLIDDYSGTGNTMGMGTSTNYNLRLDGNATVLGFGNSPVITDINSDGNKDLVIGNYCGSYNSRTCSGSVYVLYNSLISGVTGTGNIVSMASSTSFNARFDGPVALAYASQQGIRIIDTDADGGSDLLFPAYRTDYNSRTDSGSLYLVKQEIFSSLTGTGDTFDLAESTAFSIRFDGAATNDYLTLASLQVADFNNNGKADIIVGSRTDNNSRTDSGSLYLIFDSIINSYAGTGNTVDLSLDSSHNARIDGSTGTAYFASYGGVAVSDLDSDGSLDIIVSSYGSDSNSRADSGSVYLIYNFPHSVSLNSFDVASGEKVSVSGSISVSSSSVSSLSGVQVSLDDSSPSASSWVTCSADDGVFDESEEKFSCNDINISSFSSGTRHIIYVRATDTNGSYTPRSRYAEVSFFKDYNSTLSSNCPTNFKHCVHGGSGFSGTNTVVSGGSGAVGGIGKVIVDKSTNKDDLFVTISSVPVVSWNTDNPTVPLPWTKGLNTASDIFNFNSVSSFNGYPIQTTDKPFVIQLTYDLEKLTKTEVKPQSLKIAYFNEVTNTWTNLSTPMVVDSIKGTIASTTNKFGLYTVVYPKEGSQGKTRQKEQKEMKTTKTLGISTKTQTQKDTLKGTTRVLPKKACFLWWCW